MASATQGFHDLMDTLRPLASSAESRALLVTQLLSIGIHINHELRLQGAITDEQLAKVIDAVDVKAVWKIAARRALRPYGY
jgi:hypothetical protein